MSVGPSATYRIDVSPLAEVKEMPLPEVARRYADKVYQKSVEEIIQKYQSELVEVRTDHAARNMLTSGAYVAAHGRLLVEQIRQLGEARADSLLKAYEKAGLPFDDAALTEVQSEVVQLCHNQQHYAVSAITQAISQIFGGQSLPPSFEKAAATEIVNGVNVIMSRLTRDLSIKRDEVILDESKVRKAYAAGLGKKWDVFICHATEDKEAFVRPLVLALEKSGLAVWYDEFTLKIGDSLRQKIDEGLANSRFGIVVLSKFFFAKNWPRHELDGLVSKEVSGTGTKVILPVWNNISFDEVSQNSPMLAGRVAAKSQDGIETVVRQLREAMGL